MRVYAFQFTEIYESYLTRSTNEITLFIYLLHVLQYKILQQCSFLSIFVVNLINVQWISFSDITFDQSFRVYCRRAVLFDAFYAASDAVSEKCLEAPGLKIFSAVPSLDTGRILNIHKTSYLCSIYILCPRGRASNWNVLYLFNRNLFW